MYYNKILQVWVLDQLDYLILSTLFGSLIGSRLKEYRSEKQAMKRLKKSVIKKAESKPLLKSSNTSRISKKKSIQMIYKFAVGLRFRGGHEIFHLVDAIKFFVERLAGFLKQKELNGLIATIFFKSGRLFLELILAQCRISIDYVLLTEGLNTQVIVITTTIGGITGFTLSWVSAAAGLVIPPLLTSTFLLRSFAQQVVSQREYLKYLKFKKLFNQVVENVVENLETNHELKQAFKTFVMEIEGPTTPGIEMKAWNLDKTTRPEFSSDPEQTLKEFVQKKMQEELGLIENPSSEHISEIIRKRPRKKGKTVYFNDFIKKNVDEIVDVDAEIINEAPKPKIKLKRIRNDQV